MMSNEYSPLVSEQFSLPTTQTRIIFEKRPGNSSIILGETFRSESVPLPSLTSLNDGEVLVEVLYLSLDPAMRGWLNDARSYISPVKIGEVMRAYGIGVIVGGRPKKDSASQSLAIGDIVTGVLGWQEYSTQKSSNVTKRELLPGMIVSDWLGVLGPSGITAVVGMLDVAKVKEGETLVVSGAAGSVGMIACQIGKIYKCKTIAIAGSDAKCEWLKTELQVDETINYKDEDWRQQFKQKVGYLNVMFDNVGGEILNYSLSKLQPLARIAFCGAISDYNQKATGPSNYKNLIAMRATLQGFLYFDYAPNFSHYESLLAGWLIEGKIKRQETWIEGIERAPEALLGLFEGKNTGKMLLKVKDLQNGGVDSRL